MLVGEVEVVLVLVLVLVLVVETEPGVNWALFDCSISSCVNTTLPYLLQFMHGVYTKNVMCMHLFAKIQGCQEDDDLV
jgi:hypothetical protein